MNQETKVIVTRESVSQADDVFVPHEKTLYLPENGRWIIDNFSSFMSSMKLPVPSISNDLPIFITDDLSAIRELYNHINMEKGQLEQCIAEDENYRIRVERLITFINRKYHLE